MRRAGAVSSRSAPRRKASPASSSTVRRAISTRRPDLGFPVYARSVTARTARGRIIEVSTGQPVTIGDVTVTDGDYVLADGSAVTFIPVAQIEKVVAEAEKLAAREGLMAKAAREGKLMSQVMGADYEQMLKG